MKKRAFSVHVWALFLLASLLCPTLASCKNDPCAHKNATWITEKEPTTDAAGSQYKKCTDCSEILETASIPALTDPVQAQLAERLAPSMVKVVGYAEDGTKVSQGSGFFVSENGTFVTNAHVVESCHYVQIETHTGQVYNANALLAISGKTSDYAILSIAEAITVTPVTFNESPTLESTVYALGYPDNAPALCVTGGTLLYDISNKYCAASPKIASGSSGGPLTDPSGCVIGIVTSLLKNKECMVLKYSDFKAALKSALAESATPVKELPLRPTV